jgi:hypothetical protein
MALEARIPRQNHFAETAFAERAYRAVMPELLRFVQLPHIHFLLENISLVYIVQRSTLQKSFATANACNSL